MEGIQVGPLVDIKLGFRREGDTVGPKVGDGDGKGNRMGV